MKKIVLFALPGNEELTHSLGRKLKLEIGEASIRSFPDGETYIRINSDVANKTIILVCSLDNPNQKLLPLMFMAKTIKELRANKICLITPYLPYMRQDKSFHPGEGVTSVFFSQLLSSCFDGMLTIDPHLHRISKLSEIYTMPNVLALHATQTIAEWIIQNVKSPLLIGPDEESRQWVGEIADINDIPFVIGEKKRLDDKHVIVSLPSMDNSKHVPVLVDDVISTGQSMIETIKQLKTNGFNKPVCIGVHALFDSEVENNIIRAGAEKILTCNTIKHSSNKIDITDIIAQSITELY
jgi:ribose-phosphate pyrophosphokinase